MKHLGKLIRVQVEDPHLDFVTAKNAAKQEAKKHCADPMLLSWYQGKTGEGYPNLECGKVDAPAWVVYAESRGGGLTIDVNDGDYMFFYLSLPKSDFNARQREK
jgi:hypothetical protein